MENKNESMGQRILRLMLENKLSQRELAGLSGVTPAAMNHYIKDKRVPRPDAIKNMATALGTTVDYLLTGKDEEVEYNQTYSMVARCRSKLTKEQKFDLLQLLLK